MMKMLRIWTYTSDDFTYKKITHAKVEKPNLSLHVNSILLKRKLIVFCQWHEE